MTTSTKQEPLSSLTVLVSWIGRVVAGGSVYIGLVALYAVSEVPPDQLVMQFSVALLGLMGGLLFFFGLECSAHRLSRLARTIGWVMMSGFALFPGMVWFLLAPLVMAALPAVFLDRRPG
jgi:hypothetical protein